MFTIYQGKKSFTFKEFHSRTCCFYDIYRINFNPFLEVRCHFRPTLSYSGLHIGLTEMAKDEVIKGLYNCLLKKRDVRMGVIHKPCGQNFEFVDHFTLKGLCSDMGIW